MARALGRSRSQAPDHWPGFVDAMATLLLVVTFLLSVFMLTQYFVQQESSGKDTMLERLNRQLSELTEMLALERSKKASLQDTLASLSATLSDTKQKNANLESLLGDKGGQISSAEDKVSLLTNKLDEQRQISANALAKVELLNQQLSALRRQIAALEEALNASESSDKESQAKIADLGRRLNLALAKKVQELSRYRSDFFGELRKVLGSRDDIQVRGDRFVFQSEVLFDSGSAEINDAGKDQLNKVAAALNTLKGKIPANIDWILQIDGHTDANPIYTDRFHSNWELSSARAISVVQYLIDRGVPPDRLVAAGFGEYQPIVQGDTPADMRKNRRIELKLTQK